MSKVAKSPVVIPAAVEVEISGQTISAKGGRGANSMTVHADVAFSRDGDLIRFEPRTPAAMPLAGTMRSLVNNLVQGVAAGFERKLELVGVGYRARLKDGGLNLQLGFSHPVHYKVREGVELETPSQTEIVVSGVDKQAVSQTAAEIRAFRPPEPYKGKGVRYAGEQIIRKQAKKK